MMKMQMKVAVAVAVAVLLHLCLGAAGAASLRGVKPQGLFLSLSLASLHFRLSLSLFFLKKKLVWVVL